MTIFTNFKKLTILAVALLGFLVIANWDSRAGTTKPVDPIWKQSDAYTIIVAQNETQTATSDTHTPSSESKASEPKTDEKKESAGAKKKPLKDFKPSERIEAEQAVDFPYDI